MLAVNIREGWRGLMAAKQRSILALIGVVIGIGSVMAMLSIGETVKAQALKEFMAMGTDILTVSPSGSFSPGAGERYQLNERDLGLLNRYSRHVVDVSPEASSYGKITMGDNTLDSNIRGVRAAYQRVNKLETAQGRFLGPLDRGRSHTVLGSALAARLKKGGNKEGQIKINNRPFQVIGELAPAQIGYRSQEIDNSLMIPLDMAQQLSGRKELGQVVLKVRPDTHHEKAMAEIKDYLGKFSGGTASVYISSPRQLIENMAKQMRLYTLLLAAVGAISLVVGGVGIMNMMLTSVTERRKEIGIRRALGAQRRDIIWQFLVESTILSLVGGLLGVGLGAGAGYIAAQLQGWPPIIPLGAALLSAGVAAGVGVFFGYYPAHKAARLDVIVALRTE